MKTSFLVIFLLTLGYNLNARDKIIDNPSYEVRKSGIYNVSRIEIAKNETRIHMHCTFIHNWWVKFPKATFIQDSDTGEKLYATAIIGGEFEKEILMPVSGDSSFVLIFPKLNKTTSRINYGEKDKIYIFGLSLDPDKQSIKATNAQIPVKVQNWISEELAKARTKTLVEYDSPEFIRRDTARLIGYIKGYDPRLGFNTGIIYASNEIANEDFPMIITIHEDGRFEGTIPMNHPKYNRVAFNQGWIYFYIEPGQTLSMILNWDEFLTADRLRNIRYKMTDIKFEGTAARINQELMGVQIPQPDYDKLEKSISSQTPEEFKASHLASWKESENKLEQDLKNKEFSPQAKTILRNSLAVSNGEYMFDYVMRRQYEARIDSTNKQILTVPVNKSYYDFLQRIPLNDPGILISFDFSGLVNRFEFSSPFISNIYSNEVSNSKRMLQQWEKKDSILKNYYHLQPNLLYDITKVRSLKFLFKEVMKDNKDEARTFLTAFEKGISNPAVMKEAELIFNASYPQVPKAAYQLPPGKGSDIFKKIIDPHKGKIVFVDFWGIFCGPCVASIRHNKPLRANYQDSKDIEFVFVTSIEESPKPRYSTFVKENELQHTVRSSDDDYRYLRQLFKFNGIPRYIVIDREGLVLNDDFPMHNFESELEKLLVQK